MTSALASGADKVGAGHTEPVGFHEVRISAEGSTRGTAYIESNKILMAREKVHVAWLDAGLGGKEGVRIRTLDLHRGEWSAAVTLGEAKDNHGGPALVRDSKGYLHVLFGPHHQPFSYRRSVHPDDASEWKPVEHFGERCTYPSLVCDEDNMLHMVCRESNAPGWPLMYYCCEADDRWSEGRPIIEPDVKDGNYRCYRASLSPDTKGRLHLTFQLYPPNAYGNALTTGAVGYLCSDDGGQTWRHADGRAVTTPTTNDFDRIEAVNTSYRISNLACDPDGIPYVVTVSSFENQDLWGQATLWKHGGTGWNATNLLPCLQKAYPGYRAAWIEPSVSFGNDGRLFVALVAVDARSVDPGANWYGDPKSIYGHSSSRIALLVSADGGQTFAARRVGQDVPNVPSWIPSMERFTGHNEIGVPRLLYTHGVTGHGCNPKDVVTEIRLVSFDATLPDMEQPTTNLNP